MACDNKCNLSQAMQCGGRISAELRVLARGRDGKSAYQTAVDGGYTGTEEEFAQQLANTGKLDFVSDEFINGMYDNLGGN